MRGRPRFRLLCLRASASCGAQHTLQAHVLRDDKTVWDIMAEDETYTVVVGLEFERHNPYSPWRTCVYTTTTTHPTSTHSAAHGWLRCLWPKGHGLVRGACCVLCDASVCWCFGAHSLPRETAKGAQVYVCVCGGGVIKSSLPTCIPSRGRMQVP